MRLSSGSLFCGVLVECVGLRPGSPTPKGEALRRIQ